MPSKSRFAVICLALVLALGPRAICAEPEAVLHYGSGTTVDGTKALDGMHVFRGQFLRTPPGRFNELLTRGSTLRLFGDTSLKFDGDSAELVSGGVTLNTSVQFPLRSGCSTITPAGKKATRFTVQLQEKTVYVSATQDDVWVKSSRKSKRIPAGKTAAVFCGSAAEEILFVGKDVPVGVIAASAGAAASGATFPRLWSKPNPKPSMSADSPGQ